MTDNAKRALAKAQGILKQSQAATPYVASGKPLTVAPTSVPPASAVKPAGPTPQQQMVADRTKVNQSAAQAKAKNVSGLLHRFAPMGVGAMAGGMLGGPVGAAVGGAVGHWQTKAPGQQAEARKLLAAETGDDWTNRANDIGTYRAGWRDFMATRDAARLQQPGHGDEYNTFVAGQKDWLKLDADRRKNRATAQAGGTPAGAAPAQGAYNPYPTYGAYPRLWEREYNTRPQGNRASSLDVAAPYEVLGSIAPKSRLGSAFAPGNGSQAMPADPAALNPRPASLPPYELPSSQLPAVAGSMQPKMDAKV